METNKAKLYIVYLLAIVGDLTAGILLIITIIYSTQIGLSTIEVGLIGSAYGLSYVIMPAILSKVGDKLSRKNCLLIATTGQMMIAILLIFVIIQSINFIFIGFFTALILFGVICGFFWPSIEAYISENTDHLPKAHERGIANFCLAWSIGYTLAPLFAGYFSDYSIVMAFIFIFICFLGCFLLVFFGLPSITKNNINKINGDKIESTIKIDKFNNLDNKPNPISNITMITILLVMGVMMYATIAKIVLAYFPNYAVMPNGLGWTGTLTGQVMLFYGLGRTLYFIIGRYLKNSFAALTQSFLIMSICLMLMFFVSNPLSYIIIFFIFGFFVGRTYLVSLELILKQEQESKGAKAGIFESFIGFGSVFTPIVAGILASIDLKLPFIVFSIMAFVFVIIHFSLLKKNEVINLIYKI